MQVAPAKEQIESKYRSLASVMDERMRRHWAATEARAYGWGGVRAVSGAIGMSPNTIRKGLTELAAREKYRAPLDFALAQTRRWSQAADRERPEVERRPGVAGGAGDARRPGVAVALDLQEHARLARGADAAGASGQRTDGGAAAARAGYSLQGNRKTKEGASHPDRNAQFEHINAKVKRSSSAASR